MVGRQGRARAEDSAEAWLFTLFVITHVVEGQSFPLPCEPLAGQQVSFLWCMSVPLLAMKILTDLF
ncbi:unnamed protein product [Prunus armeniaca]